MGLIALIWPRPWGGFVSQKKLKDVPTAQFLTVVTCGPGRPDDPAFYRVGGCGAEGSDSSRAILMDFRCDQSRGIHFIYLLPFDDRTALVESTMFAPNANLMLLRQQSSSTLRRMRRCQITTEERGWRNTLGRLPRSASAMIGLGSNGGAIDPQVVAFLHSKQIADTISRAGQAAATTDGVAAGCAAPQNS